MAVMTKEQFDKMFVEANPAQCPVELWWLIEKLNKLQPSKILEVGGGATSFFWGYIAPTISLTLDNYAVSDVPHVPLECLLFEETDKYEDYPSFTGARTFVCNSHRQETFEKVKALGPFDFLFIDGDHTRVGCQQDIEMYMPLIREGGILAMHDWTHQGTYEPDGDCHPVQLAWSNLKLPPPEVKISPRNLGYGIAVLRI